jgi:hypothetical protein
MRTVPVTDALAVSHEHSSWQIRLLPALPASGDLVAQRRRHVAIRLPSVGHRRKRLP